MRTGGGIVTDSSQQQSFDKRGWVTSVRWAGPDRPATKHVDDARPHNPTCDNQTNTRSSSPSRRP